MSDKYGKMNKIIFIKGARFTPWPNNPQLLVIHWAATTGAGCVRTFLNPTAQGSAHYIIYENGSIVQMVEERHIAWHAGRSAYKNYPTCDKSGREWQSLNPCSIGIECAGPPSILKLSEWPEPEIKSLIDICRDIKTRYPSIKLTDHWAITEHGKPDSRSDVRDGKGVDVFPWQRLLDETGIIEA